ncbi:MAG: MBL fold metallo-hydrolase [Deltaproteobacteria bacterium]|nr:MBL fold metallo-hydrolase [Deltaproteobacteria bacterium]
MQANIIKYSNSLYLIELPVNLLGFNNFIGAWVYKGEKTLLIDPGPASTVEPLCNALEKIKIIPDYILLTHIHIDHSGSIGDISKIFNKTPIVCHSAAFQHLINPNALWKGSVAILKEKAYAYGKVKPVNKNLLIKAENFSEGKIKTIETPGHSAHSVSFIIDEHLFAGEACGVHFKEKNNREYLRPATPPKLFLKTAIKSILKLMELKPKKICFGHFGISESPDRIMKKHIDQLILWENIIKKAVKTESPQSVFEYAFKKLLLQDEMLAVFNEFNEKIKKRELFFIKNSFNGFLQYLNEN